MKYLEKLCSATKQVKSKHLVSVRKLYLSSFRKEYDEDHFMYLNIQYSFEKGAEFMENKNHSIEFV